MYKNIKQVIRYIDENLSRIEFAIKMFRDLRKLCNPQTSNELI